MTDLTLTLGTDDETGQPRFTVHSQGMPLVASTGSETEAVAHVTRIAAQWIARRIAFHVDTWEPATDTTRTLATFNPKPSDDGSSRAWQANNALAMIAAGLTLKPAPLTAQQET